MRIVDQLWEKSGHAEMDVGKCRTKQCQLLPTLETFVYEPFIRCFSQPKSRDFNNLLLISRGLFVRNPSSPWPAELRDEFGRFEARSSSGSGMVLFLLADLTTVVASRYDVALANQARQSR